MFENGNPIISGQFQNVHAGMPQTGKITTNSPVPNRVSIFHCKISLMHNDQTVDIKRSTIRCSIDGKGKIFLVNRQVESNTGFLFDIMFGQDALGMSGVHLFRASIGKYKLWVSKAPLEPSALSWVKNKVPLSKIGF